MEGVTGEHHRGALGLDETGAVMSMVGVAYPLPGDPLADDEAETEEEDE